jgi:hypothetical protein
MPPWVETSSDFQESFRARFCSVCLDRCLVRLGFGGFLLILHMSWSCRGELYLKTENVGALVSDVKFERYLKILGLFEPDEGFVVSVAKEFTQKHRAIIERSVFSCCS